jgi:transcriptional regulator with XRE-family HTH domain
MKHDSLLARRPPSLSSPVALPPGKYDQVGDAPSRFGDIIAELRVRKRLSATETARRAGISRQHLYRIEKGIVPSPGRDIVLRIAGALETTPALLFAGARSTRAQKLLTVLWQHSSEIGSDDADRLEEIQRNLMRTLRSAGRT